MFRLIMVNVKYCVINHNSLLYLTNSNVSPSVQQRAVLLQGTCTISPPIEVEDNSLQIGVMVDFAY